jgi:hypothetical protein
MTNAESFNKFDPKPFYRQRGWLIGDGAVGGKARGLAFASAALEGATEVQPLVGFPELTYVVSTEIFDEFLAMNNLREFVDQSDDYNDILEQFENAPLPPALAPVLSAISERIPVPIAVRSSSILEDDTVLSFAGKYATRFFGNTGSPEYRLKRIERAVKQVFASTFNPSAREYQRKHGIEPHREKMAVLIQPIVGRRRGSWYYPEFAATAYSKVFRRPSPRINKDDGVMRVCFGLGTRTVDRVFARTFYLTNPNLRAEGNRPADIFAHSQEEFDYVDLEHGFFLTGRLEFALAEIIKHHKFAPAFIEWYDGNMFHWLHTDTRGMGNPRPAFTFADFPRRCGTLFKATRRLLTLFEEAMGLPADMEMVYESDPGELTLVQLRPLSTFEDLGRVVIPSYVPENRLILRGNRMVANGLLRHVSHLVYVDPDIYGQQADFYEVARGIGAINAQLEGKRYILVGPGRWGSTNPALGVPVLYNEISNCGCLVELGIPSRGMTPELSYGTHFFLDLDVDNILYLPVFDGASGNIYAKTWFDTTPYVLGSHPSIRIYQGNFDVFLDGEEEIGVIIGNPSP